MMSGHYYRDSLAPKPEETGSSAFVDPYNMP